MAQRTERKATLLTDDGQPLVLVGPPRGVRGQFRVQNATARKVVVRQPVITPASRARAKAAPAGAAADLPALPGTALALRRIIVRAGQSRPVPLALTLDPTTPPGTYQAELDIDGEQRRVVVHVTEDVSLSITPDELVIATRPSGKVQKRVVFTNDGNVPVTVKSIGVVVLDEELVHCRVLRGALADVGDTMQTLDDFTVALGRRYRAAYGTLALKVQNDEVTMAPGETVAVDLRIALPEKLERRSRYTGYAAISTGTLTFTIVPD
jgi:hypothetical protein